MGAYKLVGKCKQCGKCCKVIRLFYENEGEHIITWLAARSIKIIKISDKVVCVEIDSVCKNLTKNNLCLLAKNKPSVCRDYPNNMYNLEETCDIDPNLILCDDCGYEFCRKD